MGWGKAALLIIGGLIVVGAVRTELEKSEPGEAPAAQVQNRTEPMAPSVLAAATAADGALERAVAAEIERRGARLDRCEVFKGSDLAACRAGVEREIARAREDVEKGVAGGSQAQSETGALIRRLIAEGVFRKVEMPGTLPRVWVTPTFFALDFDTKQAFIGVVYAHYFDGSDMTDSVRVYDSLSNKEIGSFSTVYGGLRLF